MLHAYNESQGNINKWKRKNSGIAVSNWLCIVISYCRCLRQSLYHCFSGGGESESLFIRFVSFFLQLNHSPYHRWLYFWMESPQPRRSFLIPRFLLMLQLRSMSYDLLLVCFPLSWDKDCRAAYPRVLAMWLDVSYTTNLAISGLAASTDFVQKSKD